MVLSRLRRIFGAPASEVVCPLRQPSPNERDRLSRLVDGEGLAAEVHAECAAGRFGEALRLLRVALAATPHDPRLEVMRLHTLLAWGRAQEATAGLINLAARDIEDARVWGPLGLALLATGRTKDAQPWLRRAMLNGAPEAPAGLVQCLQKERRTEEALALCDAMLCERPGDLSLWSLKGQCHLLLGQPEESAVCLRRVLDANPANWWASFNLGIALRTLRQHDDALAAFARAHLNRDAGVAFDTFTDLALAYQATGQLDRGIAVLEENLPGQPSVEGHRTYGQLLLVAGRLPDAWTYYEFRWMLEPLLSTRRPLPMPVWTGQSLAGRSILVRVEQGLGDVIQFMRYALLLEALGARVVIGNFSELAPHFAGVGRVLAAGDEYADIDFHINLLSIPRVFGTDAATIPAPVPYVTIDPDRVTSWRHRLASAKGLRVGLVWAGNPMHPADKQRSVGMKQMSALLDLPGVCFFGLQKGPAAAQIQELGLATRVTGLDAQLHDFRDTAAAISLLDLVICVDTSVGHLAGALGKRVWMLLANPADWRWLEAREDTPWYPTMRLFRQRDPDDWNDVIRRVRVALEDQVATGVGDCEPIARPVPRLPAPRSVESILANHRPGFCAITETAEGILQFLPEEPTVGKSLAVYGEYLKLQLELLQPLLRPGMTVVEVGAGIGAHALFLACALGPDGKLFLIEDDPVRRRILRQNLLANRHERATVLGETRVEPTPGMEVSRPLVPTIDDLQLERLDWIKLSLGSAAVSVILGAQETLWRLRPRLFASVDDQPSAVAVSEVMGGFGYRRWFVQTPLFNCANFNRHERDIFAARQGLSVIGFPEEGNDEFAPKDGVEIP